MPKRSHVTIDHDEIRRWAEERGAKPAFVRGTGIIRLDFPGFTGEDKLKHVSWDEFFDRFEETNLALIIEEKTARGQKSNFNKLIGRETVDLASGELTGPPRRRAKQGARTQRDARRIRATQARAAGSKRRAPRAGASSAKASRAKAPRAKANEPAARGAETKRASPAARGAETKRARPAARGAETKRASRAEPSRAPRARRGTKRGSAAGARRRATRAS